MSKNLQQIQKENRKAIIMACNSESKSYEEALKMELGFGCELWIGDRVTIIVDIYDITDNRYFKAFDTKNGCILENELEYLTQEEILGKPLTLDRVLLAIKKTFNNKGSDYWYKIGFGANKLVGSLKFWFEEESNYSIPSFLSWDLTKPTLEMQTKEVQRSINKILMGNE